MRVAPNQVYVIPPNADLAIEQGVLRVLPPPPRRGSRTAIDMFLRSLAADQQERAIGVILSGTGSHGAIGIKEVKHGGGMVIAQTPESAEHDQMPRNAIATGAVDHVLPPDQIPPAIARYARHLASPGADVAPEDLEQVLSVLKTQLKRDFRGYRRNMLLRRVKRRMGLRRLDNVAAYVENLRDHRDEAQALAKDLSISVTEFFREPEAFDVLERVVVPELIRRAGRAGDAERPVRVWVPGCATGEEAYSIAMLFLEQFAAAARPVGLQIFATDIDEESLDLARTGIYPDTLAANVTAARLRQFFIRADAHHYQVSKPLRDVITFAPQNLLADAPFSRLDLIACRNVLIYLEPDVQAKILTLFHFALLDGGFLLLGPAEAIGLADRFEPVSKKWRVFRRIGNGRRDVMDIPILLPEPLRPRAPRDDPPRSPQSAADVLHRALVADFAPAAVLVNGRVRHPERAGPRRGLPRVSDGRVDARSALDGAIGTSDGHPRGVRAGPPRAPDRGRRRGSREAAIRVCDVYGDRATGRRRSERRGFADRDVPGSAGAPAQGRTRAPEGVRAIGGGTRRRASSFNSSSTS